MNDTLIFRQLRCLRGSLLMAFRGLSKGLHDAQDEVFAVCFGDDLIAPLIDRPDKKFGQIRLEAGVNVELGLLAENGGVS